MQALARLIDAGDGDGLLALFERAKRARDAHVRDLD